MAGAAVCAVDSLCVRASQKCLAIGIHVTCSNILYVFDTSWLIFRCCSLSCRLLFVQAAAAVCVTAAGFFVHLAGGAASLCRRLPQGSLPGTWTSLISSCFGTHSVLCLLQPLCAAALGRACQHVTRFITRGMNISAFKGFRRHFLFWCLYLGRASWLVTRARGLHHVLSYIFGPHIFLWPLPGCEVAAASWAYDIVCSLNSESRDLAWLPRVGVLRPVPRMWDPFFPPPVPFCLAFCVLLTPFLIWGGSSLARLRITYPYS